MKLHCWKSRLEHLAETVGRDSKAYREVADGPEHAMTCMLERDHDGPHEWTPDGQIVFTVAPRGRA